MTDEQIKRALLDYNEQDNIVKNQRESLRKQIRVIEDVIMESYERNPYEAIYKSEYGNYKEFVNILANKLREL